MQQYQQPTSLTIKHWAEEDRPREKLLLKGKSSLSDAELIGILIGSGTREKTAVEVSREILSAHGNDLNAIAKLSVKALMKFKGIGEAKAISIVSALELGRRRKESEPKSEIIISSSEDVYHCIKPHLEDLQTEEFWILLLNRRNKVIRKQQISSGGVSTTSVDPKRVFHEALSELASGIVLIHNHPSGNLKPSGNDIELTKKIKNGAEYLDITIIDHIIYTERGYYSFADNEIF